MRAKENDTAIFSMILMWEKHWRHFNEIIENGHCTGTFSQFPDDTGQQYYYST